MQNPLSDPSRSTLLFTYLYRGMLGPLAHINTPRLETSLSLIPRTTTISYFDTTDRLVSLSLMMKSHVLSGDSLGLPAKRPTSAECGLGLPAEESIGAKFQESESLPLFSCNICGPGGRCARANAIIKRQALSTVRLNCGSDSLTVSNILPIQIAFILDTTLPRRRAMLRSGPPGIRLGFSSDTKLRKRTK